MDPVFRILDASLNRAREAARVLEDHARFIRDDPGASARLKAIRHTLAEVEQDLGREHLLAARDTANDTGRDLGGAGEYRRDDSAAVLAANFRRLQEALRSIEEYAKLLAPPLARGVERARYEAYQLERDAAGPGAKRRELLLASRVMVLVTAEQCVAGVESVIGGALRAGVRCFQLREKTGSDRERMGWLRSTLEVLGEARRECLLIVNDRVDMALALGADGVHLGAGDMPVRDARQVAGADLLIGGSARDRAGLARALDEGADYLGAGAMFGSTTKRDTVLNGPAWGAEATQAAQAGGRAVPVFCIGGVSSANLRELCAAFEKLGLKSGSLRIAVSSAVCAAPDPEAAARELVAAVGER